MPADDERTRRIQHVWTVGSYAAVGDTWADIGRGLAAELDAAVGLDGVSAVDAACGTGNTTLALAARGARVVGVDLTPALLDVARARADTAGLDVDWREGDLLALPVATDAADVVTSTFGVFLADDPPAAAAELARVCRSGGTIALTAWSDPSPFTAIREVAWARHPELRDTSGFDPAAWAREDALVRFFAGTGVELVDLEHRTFPFRHPTLEDAYAFFSANSGPTVLLREAVLAQGGDWDEVGAEVVAGWGEHALPTDDGGVALPVPYARAILTVR